MSFIFIKASYSGLDSPLTLNYNSNGVISLQLPQGPQSDSYYIYLSVNVIDDSDGSTTFTISSPVQVLPNNNTGIFESILADKSSSQTILEQLNSGNLNLISSTVISLANSLNNQNSFFNFSNDQQALIRKYLMDKLTPLSVSDISSLKVLSSALSVLTQTYDQVSASLAVN